MNREVEERIVAMYFDNKDFEQNAKQTIETLGQLKEGLDLEDSAKGFKVFDKIKDALNMNKANQGARQLRNTLTGLSNTMSKALNIGEAPVRAMDNLFSTFRGYLTKFIGFDLAGKVVNTVESTMRQLTIAPISAGWTQYESKMDSVKTIMSGTEESIEVVEEHLKNLTDYANKTIYSLSDMTSNLGKFTNNGVKLEEATAAMKGIANATADAGQGAQQASMAMYNISQAIGVGKMTTIDWKSLENANIATQKLKNTFLEVAAAGGRLEKQTDGNGLMHFFLTKDENGQALKEKVELTAANFREYLSKGWLDKETMLKTFQLYSGEGITVDTLKAWGIDNEEDQKRLMQIGQEALEAAQQVRTFSKMMDALKESVQSGWADSFQLIFGNMEEGTTLWTDINERLDKVLSGTSERRNAILKEWAEMDDKYASVFTKEGEHGEKIKAAEGGRDILVKSFFELMDVAMEFGKVVSDSFHKVFGTLDAKGLMNITLGFRNLVNTIKQWFGSMDDAGSRISKISKVLTGIFSVVKVGFNFLKAGFSIVKKIAKPVVDMLLDAFSGIGEFLTGMGDLNIGQFFAKIGEGFNKLWEKIKAIFVPKDMPGGGQELPIVTWIREKWQGLKKAIRDWANDNGLSGIIDAISSFAGTILGWDGWNQIGSFFESGKQIIVDAWEAVKNWPVWRSIGSFLTDTWDWVLKILGLRKDENGDATAGTESITEGISAISDSAQEAAKARAESNRKIRALLGDEPEFGNVDMEMPEDGGFSQNILGWLGNAWNTISDFWKNTFHGETAQKVWSEIAGFFTDTWNWIKDAATVTVGFFTQPQEDGDTGFINWVQGIWEGISNFWQNVILGPRARSIWNAIAGFFTDTWNWIATAAGTAVTFFTEPDGYTGETGFVTWIRGVWESISTFWNEEILSRAKPLWEAIAGFCSNTWGWISSQFKQRKYDERGFELNEVQEAPVVTWLSGIWESIKGVWNDVVGWDGWGAIGEFLSNTWGWITGLFSGSEVATAGASEEAVAKAEANAEVIEEATKKEGFLNRIIESVGKFFERILKAVNGVVIPKEVTAFLENVTNLIGQMFGLIGDIIGTFGRVIEAIRTVDTGMLTGRDWATIIVSILGAVTVIVLKLLNNKWLSKIGDKNAQSLGLQILEFGAGMLLISTAISLLTAVDEGKMLTGAKVLGAMIVAIGGVLLAIGTFKNTAQANPISGVERFFTNLVNKLANVAMLTIIVKTIPDIISAISAAKQAGAGNIGEDVLKIAEGVALLFSSFVLVMALTEKLTGSKGVDPRAGLSATLALGGSMVVMLAIFDVIGGAADLIQRITGDNFKDQIKLVNQAADLFTALGEGIGRFFGAIYGGFLGQKDGSYQVGMMDGTKRAAEKAMEITDDELDRFSYVVQMLGTLQDSLPDYNGLLDKWINGNKMEELGRQLPVLGEGLAGLAGYIGFLTDDDIESTRVAARLLSSFASSMSTIANVVYADGLGFANWSRVNLNEAMLNEYMTAATMLSEAVQMGLKNGNGEIDGLSFDATAVIEAIEKALGIGKTAIARAVRDMVQAGLDGVPAGEWNTQSDLRAPQELIDAYGKLSGKMATSDGTEFNLTDVLNNLIGDESTYNELMSSLELKTGEIETKIGDLTRVFNEADIGSFSITDDKTGELINTDIFSYLQKHLDTLSEELNNMDPLTVTITPVFDMTNFTPEKMQEALSSMPVRYTPGTSTTHMTIEFKGLKEELGMDAIREKLEQIRAAVALWGLNNVNSTNGLGRNIDGISNEISRMQLVIDTGALVGYIMPMIDAGLYQRSVTASRTGTVTMM